MLPACLPVGYRGGQREETQAIAAMPRAAGLHPNLERQPHAVTSDRQASFDGLCIGACLVGQLWRAPRAFVSSCMQPQCGMDGWITCRTGLLPSACHIIERLGNSRAL